MDKKEAIIVLDQVLEARSDGYEQSAWDFVKGLLKTAPNTAYMQCKYLGICGTTKKCTPSGLTCFEHYT